MGFIANMRSRLGAVYLKRKIKHLTRDRHFYNFESGKSAGVLFSAKQQEHYLQAKKFMQFLNEQGVATFGLGYVDSKDAIAYFPYKKGVDYFSTKNVNWYNKPLNTSVNDFIEHKFDMLFDFSRDQEFSILYVFAQSHAKMKVSQNFQHEIFADLFIKTKNLDVDFFEKQVKHYLSVIKTAK